jgi:hypothetical protein
MRAMRWSAGSLIVAAVLLMGPGGRTSAWASGGQEQAVVAAHVRPQFYAKSYCLSWDADKPCNEFVTAWPIETPSFVYFVVARADSALGISRVSFGVDYGYTPGRWLDYQGCDVWSFSTCADLEYLTRFDPSDYTTAFPAAGGGAVLQWERTRNCQRHVVGSWGVQAVACLFYVYAYGPDRFSVDLLRQNPGPHLAVTDCVGPTETVLDWPSHAGYVDFGGGPGYNPCLELGPVPAERTTWGRLKSQYR